MSDEQEKVEIKISSSYPKSWRLFQMNLGEPRPKGFIEWSRFLWGFDIWLGNVPFLKVMVLANILVWLIF